MLETNDQNHQAVCSVWHEKVCPGQIHKEMIYQGEKNNLQPKVKVRVKQSRESSI